MALWILEAFLMCPHVLFASSTNWVWPARLATAFADFGVTLSGIFPSYSPLRHVVPHGNAYPYAGARPLQALARAIEAEGLRAIVACDDRAVWHLQALHARAEHLCRDPQRVHTIIERSLGPSAVFPILTSRVDLLALALREDVEVPATMVLTGLADLHLWSERHGFPAFIKSDGTMGGAGVTLVGDLKHATQILQKRFDMAKTIKDLRGYISGKDQFSFWDSVYAPERRISIQAAVTGKPANILVACNHGKITGAICVEVHATSGKYGPATIASVIRNPKMLSAAAKIVKRLRLSGFIGFDFMIERDTGSAFLIEMNPRATQVGHLVFGESQDLVSAFSCSILGLATANRLPVSECNTIAFFPAAWHSDPGGCWRHKAYHDVPWEHPTLLQKIVASVPFNVGGQCGKS